MEALPLGGAAIPTTMSPIDGSSKSIQEYGQSEGPATILMN
jgi:hypothetical protein